MARCRGPLPQSRTTVTLDPEKAARIGLRAKEQKRARKFVQKTFRMGNGQEFHWDKALAVADSIEDEELSRKLSSRK
jgi:hypothetical protein